MKFKINITLTVFIILIYSAYAKQDDKVRGRVVDGWRHHPVDKVKITHNFHQIVSDSAGYFIIPLSDERQILFFEKQGYYHTKASIAEMLKNKIVYLQPILRADTITVIAARPALSELDVSSSITKINAEEFGQKEDLAELLSHQGSVLVKHYGGAESIKSISMRGMGAEQILVSIDGIPLNSSQTGMVDLDHYVLDALSEVEIYRGGFSTLFGNSAIGGVVNLSLKPPERQGLSVSWDNGAYGFHRFSGNLSFKTANIVHSLNYIRNYSSNSYRFKIDGGSGKRVNSDLSKMGFNYLTTWSPSNKNSILFHFLYHQDLHGVPRAITKPKAYQGLARMDEEEWLMRVNWAYKISQTMQIKSQIYLRRDWVDYSDPDISLVSSHFNDNVGLFLNSSVDLKPTVQLRLGINGALSKINSSETGNHDRQHTSLHGLLTWLLWQKKNTFINLNFAARGEYYSGVGPVFLPRAGVNFALEDWRFFFSTGHNFRVPTLNELYWQPGGDPNLQPEKSIAFETGVHYSWNGVITGETIFTLYYLNLHEMIRWYPTNNGLWRPKNLDRVVSKGIEVQTKFDLISDLIKSRIDYKYGISRLLDTSANNQELIGNRLAYQPSTEVKIGLESKLNNLTMGIEASYMSFRYTTLANLNDQILPSAMVCNSFINYVYHWSPFKVKIYGRINNMFKEEYQYINNYPLPLQPWKIGFQFELSGKDLFDMFGR